MYNPFGHISDCSGWSEYKLEYYQKWGRWGAQKGYVWSVPVLKVDVSRLWSLSWHSWIGICASYFLIWVATKVNTDVWVSECTFGKSGVIWTFRRVKTAVFIKVQPNWIKNRNMSLSCDTWTGVHPWCGQTVFKVAESALHWESVLILRSLNRKGRPNSWIGQPLKILDVDSHWQNHTDF
jgi:hypothetical protein